MGAEAFTTTSCHFTLGVAAALIIALEEMRASPIVATSAQTFEIIVTVVIVYLLPMKADAWMNARISAAAESSVDAVVIVLTKLLLRLNLILSLL